MLRVVCGEVRGPVPGSQSPPQAKREMLQPSTWHEKRVDGQNLSVTDLQGEVIMYGCRFEAGAGAVGREAGIVY
ncbi:hypothetical protein NDU88_013240 [Pleurodeles waltl]|uniref:Uncharacterized protein n=1 Tax=Pleurodeles waltl TaxID=8319 RepID=A0AAV7R706_PLEWA|nr:hypothetical protein NDU88_013240 [Pleurodeles waltl]